MHIHTYIHAYTRKTETIKTNLMTKNESQFDWARAQLKLPEIVKKPVKGSSSKAL